jgi:hypothetical protein
LDERRHAPTDDRWWGESWTFEFATPDGRLGGFVRLGLLPNQGTCRYWAWVVGPDRLPIAVVDDEVALPRGAGLELRGDGLWADHIVEEPFEHVSVGAEAFALRLDDPAEALAGPLIGVPTPFGLDLGWETDGPRTALDGREGYGLACRVVGEVLVGEERIELDAPGHRFHTWGVEDWWSAGRTTVAGRLADGTWFAGASDTARPTTDQPPATTDRAPFPATDDVQLADGLDLVVTPLAPTAAPIPGGPGRLSYVVRALCRFDDRPTGRTGTGWTECNLPHRQPL